mmetsp:Transcript_16845/g.34841  ORF Transcript_16845/g.34841 Transcript_16845/m.34841 type:complete len:99 (+) Transcript_16845:656-952(+)
MGVHWGPNLRRNHAIAEVRFLSPRSLNLDEFLQSLLVKERDCTMRIVDAAVLVSFRDIGHPRSNALDYLGYCVSALPGFLFRSPKYWLNECSNKFRRN